MARFSDLSLGEGLTDDDLARADALFQQALADGALPDELTVLGYGEISTAVAFTIADGERVALKRLPTFRSVDPDSRVEAYRALFGEYLSTLIARGVEVVPSRLREVGGDGGGPDDERVVYCVQPVLPAESLGPAVFRRLTLGPTAAGEGGSGERGSGDGSALRDHLKSLFETFQRVVDAKVGFDGQLSNWALIVDAADGTASDGAWHYLDVTTPLLRDEAGRDRLDADLFLAMLPRPLRPPVRRFLLHSITETYFSARSVAVDFLGNLIKERLGAALLVGIEVAQDMFAPAITEQEVRANYRSDARLWEWLLRLRRADRWWHRKFLRRPYPFLLPGIIER